MATGRAADMNRKERAGQLQECLSHLSATVPVREGRAGPGDWHHVRKRLLCHCLLTQPWESRWYLLCHKSPTAERCRPSCCLLLKDQVF